MLKRLNRLLALAAAFLMAGVGVHAQTPDVVPNKTAPPTASADRSAIVDRATRRAKLTQARAAAAARAMAAVKARGKVDPALLGTNPAVKVANDRNAAQAALVGSKPLAAAAGIVVAPGTGVPGPGFQLQQPDYMFNTAANWMYTKPLHKFVDTLAGLTSAHKNNLGNFLPVAKPMPYPADPNSDYYEIGVEQYTMQMHSDLLPTKFRGYRDLNPAADSTANGGNKSNYLGPVIIAHRDRPVRVKMVNMLPFGPVDPVTGRSPGDLFLPVDTTMEGAGVGPLGGNILYPQNRALFHLHGGLSPWISDGTPHQWNTPTGEPSPYKKGDSNRNVPDMGAGTPDDGITTYYWTNQQSGRFMFYHDHSFGMTRLNVYAGEAAGYLIVEPKEDQLISAGVLPDNADLDANGVYRYGVPLVLQDKTFVNTTFLGAVGDPMLDPVALVPQATDPTWDVNAYGGQDQLWFPHVYMVNQSPHDPSGANNFGRWDYGPWFWPPLTAAAGLLNGEQPIVGDPNGTTYPGTPNPSGVQEAFMDTPVINGTAYPVMQVQPKSYRFRILNAANDRFWNLSMFQADPTGYLDASGKPTEVRMVPSAPTATFPSAADPYGESQNWPTDGRDGGVPDPALQGPSIIQIGNESGFMPWPHEHKPQPIGYNYNRRDIVVLNVQERSLFLGPAMRADIIVDFSAFAGQRLILYNDSPAPVPAFDPRVDYYTGDPDQRNSGGANTTLPGFGPNTRTIMAFDVAAVAPAPAFDMAGLQAAWTSTDAAQGAYAATQHPPIFPQMAYNKAMNTTYTKDTLSTIQDYKVNTPYAAIENGQLIQPDYLPKAIQELFELNYGRMNATLGVELPFTNFNIQTTIPLGYSDPVTENLVDGTTQFWKITHNGVDTHPVHFHLYDLQIMNRVGWDGMIHPNRSNDYGWRETVQMNPLEDIVIAFRPISPRLPFALTNSNRSPNVTQPAVANLSVTNPVDGNAITVSNAPINFGWEYVWHCHILGHEENDFMRSEILQVATTVPADPSTLAATIHATASNRADLTWTDNSSNETGFSIQRSLHAAGAFTEIATVVPNVNNFSDYTITPGVSYDYQVVAYNQAGVSAASNIASVNAPAPVQVTGSTYTFDGVSNVPLPGVVITFTGTSAVAPVTTDASGNYTAAIPSGWTGTITPTLATYAFSPASIAIATGITANLTGQNFLARPATVTISGAVTGVPAATTVTMTAFDGVNTVTTTVASGTYSLVVPNPYTGTVTPSGTGLVFTPAIRSYNAATVDQTAQNFVAQVQITGAVTLNGVGMAGVTMTYTGGSTTTSASGLYTITLTPGWSGTVTPSKLGYFFTPISTNYVALNAGTVTNYTAVAGIEIAGQAYLPTVPITPLAGVTVSFLTGGTVNAGSAVTDATGFYYMFVPPGWSGTASASLASYSFAPVNRNFTNVTTAQTGRNFVATAIITYTGNVSSGATPLAGVRVNFGGVGAVNTDASGNYTMTLNSGFTGTITPTLRGYTFSPTSVTVTNVTVNSVQNFNTTQTITGRARALVGGAGVAGVTITYTGTGAGIFLASGSVTTNANGNFTIIVPTGWTGSVSASGVLTTWTPANFTYATGLTANVTGLRFNGQ